jgi:isopentenyl-diphosphate delta-isomerase
MNLEQFEGRKRDHIRHALEDRHQAQGWSGLSSIRLLHEALPELDFEEVSLQTPTLSFRGAPPKTLPTPFFVAGMTAGHQDAASLNLMLARACERRGWAMGVGSQRRELEAILKGSSAASAAELDRWRSIRDAAPHLTIFANLGLSQVIQAPIEVIQELVDALTAQALCIHLNALQEVLQPEGTPQFKGGLEKIQLLARELRTPVVLKETGCGISRATLEKLAPSEIAAVDVSGLGGTHWGRLEGARAQASDSMRAEAAETFADWGIPTAEAVLHAREALAEPKQIWATGGVRSGLDAAKLIALGAHRVGYAQPALKAALQGAEALEKWMAQQEFELRTALFCTGSRNPEALRGKEKVWTRIVR